MYELKGSRNDQDDKNHGLVLLTLTVSAAIPAQYWGEKSLGPARCRRSCVLEHCVEVVEPPLTLVVRLFVRWGSTNSATTLVYATAMLRARWRIQTTKYTAVPTYIAPTARRGML